MKFLKALGYSTIPAIVPILIVFLFPVHPQAQVNQPPVRSSTISWCQHGGLIWLNPTTDNATTLQYHCVDPKTLVTAPQFVPVACSPPGTTGIVMYAQLTDKTCLNLIAVPVTGAPGKNITATFTDAPTLRRVQLNWTQSTGVGPPDMQYQYFWLELLEPPPSKP